MARIYANRGLTKRQNFSTVVVIGSLLLGCFELWRAATVAPDQVGSGYLFAALFLGGGAYGARQVLMGSMDTVAALDLGPAREATIVLWRPFTTKRIEGPVDRLSDWRPYAKQVRRNLRQPMVLADHRDYPRPLEFEIGPGIQMDDAFRTLAGEALAGLETSGAKAGG